MNNSGQPSVEGTNPPQTTHARAAQWLGRLTGNVGMHIDGGNHFSGLLAYCPPKFSSARAAAQSLHASTAGGAPLRPQGAESFRKCLKTPCSNIASGGTRPIVRHAGITMTGFRFSGSNARLTGYSV